ncbi:ABC transporter ATP-binding protein [Marinobacterium jannaschii]|uniref:ABC transporter ATP-binding protein n=1 Tax=Marinobacterium jannaschii TaxID=64970 RepID=UPI0009FC72CD|nr:ABC transporter ATP-binding protein [Marinobacterium jannaschii]
MIKLEKLTKIFDSYGHQVMAANQIDMEVPSGEICVLLGPSGCGKTTTLKMINRIIHPTSGKVYINGEDTSKLCDTELRRRIGYVIQQIGLFPNMTIEDNICVVPDLLGWPKAQSRKRAKELLEMVALDPSVFLKRYPAQLSGGQQQRVGVIRALAADAPVMLMDEPFGAIDPINREIIQDEFLKMQQELNKTIMFVSHDIDEAVKMADKIAIFSQGELLQFDSPDRILANPINEFVENFVGADRAIKRLRLFTAADALVADATTSIGTEPVVSLQTSLTDASAMLYSSGAERLCCVDADNRIVGWLGHQQIAARLAQAPQASMEKEALSCQKAC